MCVNDVKSECSHVGKIRIWSADKKEPRTEEEDEESNTGLNGKGRRKNRVTEKKRAQKYLLFQNTCRAQSPGCAFTSRTRIFPITFLMDNAYYRGIGPFSNSYVIRTIIAIVPRYCSRNFAIIS